MHELSIAYNLVQTAEEAARRAQARRVTTVHLRMGALSGVVKEALLFSYDVAAAGTALEGSRLEIEELPVIVYCPSCDRLTTLPGPQHFRCATCHVPTADIRQGRELELRSLEVDDEPAHP